MATLEGLPIRDATRRLRLHVETRDVNRKQRKNPAHCALAECASRMYQTEARIYMSRAYIKAADGSHWDRYKVGDIAQREITAFDRGASFEPGDYYLVPLPPSTTNKPHPHAGNPNSKKPRAPHTMTINVRRKAPVDKERKPQ